jgi:hypothetical protein
MENFICMTCGVQYGETDLPPEHCLICEDERQYIGLKGQRWTTISEMQKEYKNRVEEVDTDITGIGSTPGFAIGQRALLVQTPNGNVLWDCGSLIDDATVERPCRGGSGSPFASAYDRVSRRIQPGLITLPSTGMPITASG